MKLQRRLKLSMKLAGALTEQRIQLLRAKYGGLIGNAAFDKIAEAYTAQGEYFQWALEQTKRQVLKTIGDVNLQLQQKAVKGPDGQQTAIVQGPDGPTSINIPARLQGQDPQGLALRSLNMDAIVREITNYRSQLSYFDTAKKKRDPRIEKMLGTWDLNRLTPEQLKALRQRYPEALKRRELFLEPKDHPEGSVLKAQAVDSKGITWQVVEIAGTGEAQLAACRLYGERSKWCTTQEHHAQHYLKQSPLYVFIEDGIPVLQYHEESGQFNNLQDQEVGQADFLKEDWSMIINLAKQAGIQSLKVLPLFGGPEWEVFVKSRTDSFYEEVDTILERILEPPIFSSEEHENVRAEVANAEQYQDIDPDTQQRLPGYFDDEDFEEWQQEALRVIQEDSYLADEEHSIYQNVRDFIADILNARTVNEAYEALHPFHRTVLEPIAREWVADLVNEGEGQFVEDR